ncbi:MAG: PKD domain-containing protein [Acidobacteriota bacterium]
MSFPRLITALVTLSLTTNAFADRPPIELVGVSNAHDGILCFENMEVFHRVLKDLERADTRPSTGLDPFDPRLLEGEGRRRPSSPLERGPAGPRLPGGGTRDDGPVGGAEETEADDPTVPGDPDPDEPERPELDAFEECLRFTSLRRELADKEVSLLDIGMDTEDIDIDMHFINDDILRTVLNPRMEVCIGHRLIKFINRGLAVEITDGRFDVLEEIRHQQACTLASLNEQVEEMMIIEQTEPVDTSGYLIGQAMATIAPISPNLHFHQLGVELTTTSCQAVFTASSQGSFTYQFTNTSTGTAPMSYLWNFGDGATSTSASPTHTYSAPGPRLITLQITTADGCTDTTNRSIDIASCNADFSWTANGGTVSFNNNSSGGTTYSWDFDDGQPLSSAANPQHVFLTSGSYEVCLTVSNASGCSDTSCWTINVDNNQCCRKQSRDKEKDLEYASGQRRIKAKISQTNVGFLNIHKVKAKTVNYKRKSGGGWKRDKASTIIAGLSGQVWGEDGSGNDCAQVLGVNSSWSENNKKETKSKITFSSTVWTRPGSLISGHYAQDGGGSIQYSMSLHDRNCP